MATNNSTVETDRRSAASRSALVYQQLRALLMDGSVAPTERLTEEALADRFEVSRTPVREALSRLQTDGLIERRDGGLYLLIPSFDTLAELYELRITLELRGIQRAIDDRTLRHDRTVLDAELAKWYGLRTALPAPDAGFVNTDEAFHQTLLRSSGNEALVDALRNVNRRIRPIRMYDYLTEDRIDATIAEHIAIAEFVRDDDLSAALAALREHVEESRQVVMERAAAALPFTRRPGIRSRP
ncbi:GntR family transcriptional regulator [Gryllotalpicola protaetiae]|uniref:GntR family transcriptional regulator n=1 Tax=Gryllotalpicola protaetiae TaxID=2419771 RepID=A0A387BY27_9MICO|nr:GntR family transcriptional regulator [Gryllotalpicola protaetiae]AYG03251.1 GntR family transcriptional regulator [Gryllotalpicola protaetiae]